MAVADHLFRVMASEAQVTVVDADPAEARRAERRLRDLEARWSRFLPDSDLSRLNRAGGGPLAVHHDTLVLVTAMVEGWRLTAGRFDPSALPALVELGYRASIEDPSATTVLDPDARPGADLDLVAIDLDASTVTLPRGAALDPGGLGKGLAADLVAEELIERGAAGALVSVGGDLAVRGRPPVGDRWSIALEDPAQPGRAFCDLFVDAGGVATSSTLSRRWHAEHANHHHLIDPATGRSADTEVASITVVADAGWRAEVLATGAAIGGVDEAIGYLEGQGVDGVVVDRFGAVRATMALPEAVAAR